MSFARLYNRSVYLCSAGFVASPADWCTCVVLCFVASPADVCVC